MLFFKCFICQEGQDSFWASADKNNMCFSRIQLHRANVALFLWSWQAAYRICSQTVGFEKMFFTKLVVVFLISFHEWGYLGWKTFSWGFSPSPLLPFQQLDLFLVGWMSGLVGWFWQIISNCISTRECHLVGLTIGVHNSGGNYTGESHALFQWTTCGEAFNLQIQEWVEHYSLCGFPKKQICQSISACWHNRGRGEEEKYCGV